MIAEPIRPASRGFTLIELTVVIIIVGILSVVAVAKLTGVDAFEVQGFFDSTKAAVRFAQKLAVAQRTNVVVVVNATSVSVCYTNPGCGSPVTDPTTGQAMTVSAPTGVSVTGPASVSFDGLGRANPGGTITVNGAGISRSLVIEQETGYVHD
jgi:MSHA pilin protein MshC